MNKASTGSSGDSRDTTAAKSLKNEIEVTEMYPMEGKKRSLAIVFCHKTFFRNNEEERVGVEADCNKLKSVLETFNFEVNIYENAKRSKIFDILNKVSQEDQSNTNCLLIIVMTHGYSGLLCAYDKIYSIFDLWNTFSEKNCPSLKGKPKLFFLQACRGDDVDSGIDLVDQENMQSQSQLSNEQNQLLLNSLPDANLYKLSPTELNMLHTPDEPDFLIGYASAPGFVAYKNKYGSWFIQEICSIFEKYGKNYDLLTLLTFVSQRVAINYTSYSPSILKFHDKKQVPCIISTLTKRLYFFPEHAEKVPVDFIIDSI